MPGAAVKAGCVERQLPPAELVKYLIEQVGKAQGGKRENRASVGNE